MGQTDACRNKKKKQIFTYIFTQPGYIRISVKQIKQIKNIIVLRGIQLFFLKQIKKN